MSNFNFYTANKAYGELYLKFPKVFLYSDKYRDLSDSAKIAYIVFKDRLQYSIRNNWVDEKGYVYFVYTNKELKTLLNCSEHKVIKIKKELEEKNLLLQSQQGFDPKRKRNLPNRLYLADLEIESHEVYSYQKAEQTLDTNGTAKNAVRDDEFKTLKPDGTAKSAVRKKNEEILDTNGTAKNSVNQYKEFKDIKDNKDSYEDQKMILDKSVSEISKDKDVQVELIENFIKEKSLIEIYGEPIVTKLKVFSFNDYETFKTYYDKLYYAHLSVQEELGIEFFLNPLNTIYAESMQYDLSEAFMRAVRYYKEGKVKKDFNNYLFGVFKSTFTDFGKQILKEKNPDEDKLPPVPLHNWLEETDNYEVD